MLAFDRLGLYLIGGMSMVVLGELLGVQGIQGNIEISDLVFFVVCWPVLPFLPLRRG